MSRRRMFFNGFLLAVLMLSLMPAPALAVRPPAPVVRYPDLHADLYAGPTYAARPQAEVYDSGVAHRRSYVGVADAAQAAAVSKAADPTTLPEPGGAVTFTVGVTNTGVETVTLTSLLDAPYGDLTDSGNPLISNSTCITGETIAPGNGVYTCTFQADVSGDGGTVHTDVVTATVEDDGGSPASASAGASVTITDLLPTIEVAKAADPTTLPEPGGAVTFTVGVTNTAAETVTLTSLLDAPYGDLADPGNTLISSRTCVTGGTLAPGGGVYSCTFQADVSGGPGIYTDVVTATIEDDESNTVEESGNAAVTITDVASSIAVRKVADPTAVPEPGGAVTFTVRVTNTSAVDSVTIDSLTDTVHGDVTTLAGSTCSVPQDLDPGEGYVCGFTAVVSGNAGDEETDQVTASGSDDDGQPVAASDDATVRITDVASSIAVRKVADPVEVPEPGGTVAFTVWVTNTSPVDSVTIDSLMDTVHGDVTALAGTTCTVPQDLGPGERYMCGFSALISGNAGDEETDEVTASGSDDDGQPVEASGQATVTITDVEPTITVAKVADPTEVPEPGETVTFTVSVTNTGVETVTLIALVDSIHGSLDGEGTCEVPQTIPVDVAYRCAFTATVSGNAGDSETDIVTAVARDDEANVAIDDASATVTVTNVEPAIEVSKVADPTVVRAGDVVEFTIRVHNRSVEPVILTGLDDDVFGDLATECGLPADVAVGGFFECVITRTISADHTDVVTATARDDEGNTATDSADASVDVIGPSIRVIKEASTASAVVGEMITYTYTVENAGDVALIDVGASDDRLGPIALSRSTLAEGEIATGTLTVLVDESDLPGPLTNTVTVTGTPPVGTAVNNIDVAVVDVEPAIKYVYLPLVFKKAAPPAPDLVVEHITVTSDSALVVIKNQGDAAVLSADEFWVDLYVNPDPIPTHVNQTWDHLCSHGVAWGVQPPALPLEPGGVITLTLGDDYYSEEYSNFPVSLPAGTSIYVQVDSADVDTTYGAVLEGHEMVGGLYNNITGPVLSTPGTLSGDLAGPESPPGEERPPTSIRRLPPRP